MLEIEERVRNRPLLVEMAIQESEEESTRLKSIPETFGEDDISEEEYSDDDFDLD